MRILSIGNHTLQRLSHLKMTIYSKFYEVDKPVIKIEGGLNEIQHIQAARGDSRRTSK